MLPGSDRLCCPALFSAVLNEEVVPLASGIRRPREVERRGVRSRSGSHDPDWAVLIEQEGAERLYLVVETKASLFTEDLRDKESAKIECGRAHCRALKVGEAPAEYVVARSLDDVLSQSGQRHQPRK